MRTDTVEVILRWPVLIFALVAVEISAVSVATNTLTKTGSMAAHDLVWME